MNPRWLVGKTISSVEMNPFDAHVSGKLVVAHQPVIRFTDGSSIAFYTQERDDGEYGTGIEYISPSKAAGKGR